MLNHSAEDGGCILRRGTIIDTLGTRSSQVCFHPQLLENARMRAKSGFVTFRNTKPKIRTQKTCTSSLTADAGWTDAPASLPPIFQAGWPQTSPPIVYYGCCCWLFGPLNFQAPQLSSNIAPMLGAFLLAPLTHLYFQAAECPRLRPKMCGSCRNRVLRNSHTYAYCLEVAGCFAEIGA